MRMEVIYMKGFKIVLCALLICLVGFAVFGNISAKSETSEVIAENEATSETEQEAVELENVLLESTLNEEDSVEVVTENQYKVEKDGVTYNYLCPIPAESDSIIEEINKIYEEEFTECNISLISDDAIEGQYSVQIGSESFIINVTL